MPFDGQRYNAPADGVPSSIGEQFNTFYWHKKALVEAKKEMYFMPLADVLSMPKHFGKAIKVYHYIPLLDDRNVNDQGIDANGVATVDGNLYGSSKDVGTIAGKLPLVGETGGRVNRVGFTRLEREGTITKFGMFQEFTQDMFDFDSDEDLYGHMSREMVTGATQLTEAVLQADLLAAAGTVLYAGAALNNGEITGEGATPSVVEYDDFLRLSIMLDDNRTPKQTTYISGSRMQDTRTIAGGRIMYIGSELQMLLEKMEDSFGNPAFIHVHQYAAAGEPMNGEIGSVGRFRIIVVPEMLHWAGVGAPVTANGGYQSTVVGGAERYDVFPMLVVGAESFTTIGFQTDGKTTKFKIITKMPGEKTADRNEPYGELGFSSIKWWYGFMSMRPERIGLIKTVAPR